jgi:hypothetical protein
VKGIIFNLLETAVITDLGEDAWDDLLDDAGVHGAYTSLGNYPDEEIEALVIAAAKKTGQTRSEVLRRFGEKAMPFMKEAYPNLFQDCTSSREFVLSVNAKIHPEVRKLYPDASCPFFDVKAASGNEVKMDYKSSRELVDLAHGFINGAAEIFGDSVEVELSRRKTSDKADQLHLRYATR